MRVVGSFDLLFAVSGAPSFRGARKAVALLLKACIKGTWVETLLTEIVNGPKFSESWSGAYQTEARIKLRIPSLA